MADPLCICGRRKSEHDLARCDKRCLESNCESFRLAAHQPDEVLVHRHGHGPKPGKGMTGTAVDINPKKRGKSDV